MLSSKRKSEQPPLTISVLPDELVVEILARLPRKQVGICKCVCKPWRSTIRSLPFRDAYRKKNSGLLLKYWSSEDTRRLRFFHCPLRRQDEPPEDFSPLTELDLLGERSVTELVDGLLCSYESGDGSSISGLTLRNISTGEKLGLPDPLPSGGDTFSLYGLGYDGVNRVYKLMRLIFNQRRYNVLASDWAPPPGLQGAHIITLMPPSGQPSTWRELPLGDCGLPSDYAYILCTARACSDNGLVCWIRRHKAIVWFDLNKERFRFADLPPDVKYGKKDEFRAVTRVKDRLALWVSSRNSDVNVVSCYVQEDDEGKSWRISKEFEVREGFAFADGIFPSSLKGEMLGRNVDDQGRVLSYSRQQTDNLEEDVFFVGKLPPGDHVFGICCPLYRYSDFLSRKSCNSWLSCLAEANNLYLSLDDILGGCFV